MSIKDKLDNLELYQLTEVLKSVKSGFGLKHELEARQNIEAGEYTEEDIIKAIAYKRTEGLGSHEKRMSFLPTSIEGVREDYYDKAIRR